MCYVLKGKSLVDDFTGEIASEDVSPKYSDWNYDTYMQEFKLTNNLRFLEPMSAYEPDTVDELDTLIDSERCIAEQKFNGHRALMYITGRGNRLFSKVVSKSGWYSENSDQMPHLRDIPVLKNFRGSVIDGEITVPVPHCDHRDVQKVTGALPETALKYQLEYGFAVLNAFDILYYKGINVQKMPYWKRKMYLYKVVKAINNKDVRFAKVFCDFGNIDVFQGLLNGGKGILEEEEYCDFLDNIVGVASFNELFAKMIKEGKEGLILKDMEGQYFQGKRSKLFTKMKAHKTYDCVIMGYEEPVRDFAGKTDLKDWQYWEEPDGVMCVNGKPFVTNSIPVTKFYAMHWIGALILGVWKDGKLVEVTRCSGFSEDIRAEISKNRDKYKGQVVEVMAQGILDKKTGSLQNPRFMMFREDKNSEACTFDAHIRRDAEVK